MKTTSVSTTTWSTSILRIVLVTVIILLIPLVAMQLTDEVKWDLQDFVVIGALLIGAGLMYELIARRLSSATHRVILGMAFVIAVLVIWVELAVGIFD